MENSSVVTVDYGWWKDMITKGKLVEVLWGDRIVLHLNCTGGFINLYMCQKL